MSFSSTPRTILIVCTRRLGDVLLATPLARSFKAQWPDARIDMLVFRGTEGVLEGNPDIDRVILVARRAGLRERIADAWRIWRRYDLACATTSSDRARFYAWFAGRKRIALVDSNRVTTLVRSMMHRIALDHQRDAHVVSSILALAPLVGVNPRSEVVAPGIGHDAARRARLDSILDGFSGDRPRQPFVVVHPYPMYRYKQWHVEGWVELIRWLRDSGYAVALSGGPAPAERAYAETVAAAAGEPVLNLVGTLSFGETAELIRRARLFVGPDTGATHVAAACGTPTLALFGPSDPVRWGPWPSGWPVGREPWPLRGSGQRGNVYLLQGEGECVPCRQEGCERHVDSPSACLADMPVRRVLAAASQLLGENPPSPPVAVVVQPIGGRTPFEPNRR